MLSLLFVATMVPSSQVQRLVSCAHLSMLLTRNNRESVCSALSARNSRTLEDIYITVATLVSIQKWGSGVKSYLLSVHGLRVDLFPFHFIKNHFVSCRRLTV